MNKFTRPVVSGSSWLILGVLLVDAALIYHYLGTIDKANADLDHSRQVIAEFESTLSTLKDAETGQRGFLLTGKPEYLEPFRSAESQIDWALAKLATQIADNPQQRARVDEIKRLATDKMAELRETIGLSQNNARDRALEIVKTDRGKRIMEQIRGIGDEFRREESRLLAKRFTESRTALHSTLATFIVTTVLSLILVSGVFFLQYRESAERERGAAALRQSEAWLLTTLTSIGDALIATDSQGCVRFMNPIAERLTGWTQAEAVGETMETVFNIVNEFTREPAEHPVARVIREGVIVGLANHTVLIAKGGKETPIEDSAAPIRDDRQGIVGVVMVFRDVTESRLGERALIESEARKAAILEAAIDAIVTIDRQGRIVDANPVTESIFGRSAAELKGASLFEELLVKPQHPAHAATINALFNPEDQGGSKEDLLGRRIELTGRKADGREFPVELAVTPIKSKGEPLYTAYLRDIKARKQAEIEQIQLLSQLESERRHLEAVIESSQDAIKELDLEGRIINVSRKTLQLLEISDPDEVLHQPWLDTWLGGDRDHAAQALAKALNGEAGWFEGFHATRSGQPKWWDVVVTPIKDPQGRPKRLLCVSRDITERRKSADERERLLAEAQEANRAKSQFLAILSHELRTPLNPILLAVSSMIDRPTPVEEVRPTLEMIRHNVNLQARLIDDLLDVMRIVQGKMPLHWGVADCHDVIRHAVLVCQSEVFGKLIRLSLELEAKEHYVNADAARLQQVFWNLIKNAVKFSPKGGTITIRTMESPPTDVGEPVGLLIEVADTGIGIEAEALPRIFDPFQQAETSITRKYGGLGLGLAICKGVIDAHGGTITAHSEGRGAGTTFRIRLNTLPSPNLEFFSRSSNPVAGDTAESAPAAILKILVVEDEEATRKLMARLLRSLGHDVIIAGTIHDAVESTDKQTFDLIVSDIGLPDGSGLDLMRKVVAKYGKVPSIALTGYGMEEDIVRSREAGFTTHMTKPIDFTKLEAMIRQVAN